STGLDWRQPDECIPEWHSTEQRKFPIFLGMDKDMVITKLREHEDELRAAGAEHLSVFGSVARGEATPESDLDILVKLSDPIMKSGLDYFSAIANLEDRIT
ncbi:nucleotidyltransferase domain-containing protein, partial [Bacillus sp. SIMBA_031]|uniref:nucleotidyltransferase family protein n=1 Tax=Bacillus sp. SIMBA_031 TaxID=3085774 RepID=UPI003978F239